MDERKEIIPVDKEKRLFDGLFVKKRADGCGSQTIESTADTGVCGCSCQGECSPPEDEHNPNLPTIKVLGTGCKSCFSLEQNVRIALGQIETKYNLVKVTDLSEIVSYGIVATPGLVVQDKVISCGKVLKPNEIVRALENIS